MRRKILAFFCLVGSLFAHAAIGLPPVPPAVWELKLSDTAQKGAVFVEHRLDFKPDGIERYYLIRILNEEGMKAAQFDAFREGDEISGCTTTRDGKVTPFSSIKDFQTKDVVSNQEGSTPLKWVIPPGLTPDCVVQLHSRSPGNYGPVSNWYYGSANSVFWLERPFPTQTMVVSIWGGFGWGYTLHFGPTPPEVVAEKGKRIATFKNLPSYDWIPYSLDTSRDDPFIRIALSPSFLLPRPGEGMDVFWKNAIREIYQPFFEKSFHYGPKWGAFSDEMRKDLPSDPQSAAKDLYFRMSARIRCLSSFSAEEIRNRSRKQERRKVDNRDLAESVEYGEATATGILFVYWELLRQANIPATPVLVVNREVRLLNLKLSSLGQFDDMILMIEEKGKPPLFIDPAFRIATAGLVLPMYQATMGLALQPGSPWTYRTVPIPAQPDSFNQRSYDYEIQPGEDGDQFSVRAEFTGILDYWERLKYLRSLPSDQVRNLKENLEGSQKTVSVAKASLGDVLDARTHFWWRAEGLIEREPSRRLEVQPFPRMPSPLWLPGDLPKERREPIVVNYLLTHTATSLVTVPDGFTWFKEDALLQKENDFGTIIWKAEPIDSAEKRQVLVTYTVSVRQMISPAGRYQEFKDFMAWMDEANKKTIVFTKHRG